MLRAAPEFPGRNWSLQRLRTLACRFDATVRGGFGANLRFEANPLADANSLEPILLQYSEPELGPILRAALRPGDIFVDVGANVGTYSLMGASLVGHGGRVLAFEPIPATRMRLEKNVSLNDVPQLRILPNGLGAEPGSTTFHVADGASGLSSRYNDAGGTQVEVEISTLDAILQDHPAPRGTDYAEMRQFLADHGGYEIFALRRSGLCPEPADRIEPTTSDVLAARPDIASHTEALATLRKVRFRGQEPAPHSRLLARLRGN